MHSAGQLLVSLEENPARETFGLRVAKVISKQVSPGCEGDVTLPVLEEGTLVPLPIAAGRRVWKAFQELRAKDSLTMLD